MEAHPESTSWISDISHIVEHTIDVLNTIGALRFDCASLADIQASVCFDRHFRQSALNTIRTFCSLDAG